MKRNGFKLLACILAALMVWSTLPVSALAEIARTDSTVMTETSAPTDTPETTEGQQATDPTATLPETDVTDTPTIAPTVTPDPTTTPSESPTASTEPTETALATPSPTPDLTLEGFDLVLADDGVIIARYTGGGDHAIVPAFVGDLPVTTIATGAFRNLETLTSVEIAEGVRIVQSGAFDNCPALTEIVLPASLNEIAEDAVTGCPRAVITAPEGSPAAAYAAKLSRSMMTVQGMDDPLPQDLNNLFQIDTVNTKMRLTPDGSDSINLLAILYAKGGTGIDSVYQMTDRSMTVYDSDGDYVDGGRMYVYFWNENGQEQLRVNVFSSCSTGDYTLKVRGSFAGVDYSCDIAFQVLSAPTLNFDDAITLTDDMGRGIPSQMYIGDATTDYSATLQVKEGSGLDRCEFENVYFDNWSIINLYNNSDWLNLQPHDPGSDTLTVQVRGYYGYNEVHYQKTFDISVAEADFERPTLQLLNSLTDQRLTVGSAGTTGVNVPFELTYNLVGGEHTEEFAANVKLHAQTYYGEDRLKSDGGDRYYFTEAGLYPVALTATYLNTTVSFNFFVEVLGDGGAEPDATFESYFNLGKNPNGDCGTLYYAPGLAISHWVAGFNIVKGAPFEASDVSYEITYEGNDEEVDGVACATIEMGQDGEEGWYHYINAVPNTAEGAGPAFSNYELKATVSKEGEPDAVYTTEFGVNMVALPDLANMAGKTLTLTTNKVQLDYRADSNYSVPMPGILLGGKSLPDDAWLNLYQTDRYGNTNNWDWMLDSEDNAGREMILSGQAYTTQLYYDRAEALNMKYVIDYGNLHWEAPFKIYLGVGDGDASALFDVNQQAYAAFIGGRADEFAWGGGFYVDRGYNIEDYGIESVSVPTGGSVKLETSNNSDIFRTDIGFSFAPSKPGTYKIRLWVDVDEDNDSSTAAVRYDHVFTLKAITTPNGLPTSMSAVDGNQLTVKAGERFELQDISIDPTIFSQYGWFNNQMIWGSGYLQESGDWTQHGPAENHRYWVDEPGRYKLVRELQIGANYYLRVYITLTVTNESNETVVTDVSDSMFYFGWDDAYTVLPKGNANNDLFMFYENDLLLGDDVTEEWSVQLSEDSVGKFVSLQFQDQYKGDQDRSSEARLVGMFPIQTGDVKFTVTYDAYQGSGDDKVLIYHGESPELTVRIVGDVASGDFRLVGTPKTYYTDASGFVHIDAFDAASSDVDLSNYVVHNDYYADDPNGYVQLTSVNDAGEDDWEHNTGVNVQIDPTKKGTYLIYQHTWASLEDTDLSRDVGFRVVVGSLTGSVPTINENSVDLSVVNLRDAIPNVSEKYYWTNAARGEKLTWKLTRTKGTSIDLGVVDKAGNCVGTMSYVLTETDEDNGAIVRIAGIKGVGLSTFELSLTVTTVDGKILTTKKTFNVNVVDQPVDGYLPTLTADKQTFEVEVGQTVEIPQPTITWPTGANASKIQRLWFWSKSDKLGAYVYNADESTRNVILCPLEAGYYTINFEVVVGASIVNMAYTVVAFVSGEAAPEAEPMMYAERLIGKNEKYFDADGDGVIEITCQMDESTSVQIPVAIFSLWGVSLAQMDKLTFTLDTPDDTGSVVASISKKLADCALLSAHYTKEIGNPVTYTMHALIDGVEKGSVEVTLLPPRVPTALDDFKTLTISAGMTYQLDVSALSAALGKPVTAFSCDYTGKTATDTRFSVSGTGLIKATGDVGKAYVYAETDDPKVLAVIEVIVKGTPASFTADKTELTFTDLSTVQTITLTAKDSLGNAVPAAIAVSGNNPAVCSSALESVDDEAFSYTYTVKSVGCGTTSITFKAMGATVTIPITVKRVLTDVTLTAPETILAGTSGTISATYDPVDASDKTLVWSTGFADGQDTTGFNNAWISMNNGVITVSKALDRITKILAIASWKVDGVDHSASVPLTLIPLVTAVTVQPIDDEIIRVGTQYVYDISKLDDETEIGFKATVSPAALEEGYAPTIQWTSSASDVASIDQNGIVTPKKPGTTNITALAMDGSKKSQTVTLVVRKFVTDVTPASLKGLTLVAGSGVSLGLTATFLPLDATLKTVTWQSDNPTLLSVNPTTGVVTAVKGATVDASTDVVITATAADGSQKSGSITLHVVPKAASVTIDSIGATAVVSPTTPINLDIQSLIDEHGDIAPLALSATVTPNDGYPVVWTSSNASAASISYDEEGNAYLTLRRAGSRITLTAIAGSNSHAKATAIINVINSGVVEPTKVTITGVDSLAVGMSATYVATLEPAATTNKSVTWQLLDASDNIINDPSIATLSQTGVLKISTMANTTTTPEVYIKAIANGATDVESEKYRVALFTKATGVTITGPEDSIVAGQEAHFIDIGAASSTLALTASVSPSTAQQAVAWSSSNTKVITVTQDAVDPCKAIVTPVGLGTAKIVATALDGTKRKAEYTVTVGTITESLSMPYDFLSMPAGGKLSLTVERTPALVTNPALIWTSSDTSVATVSSAGVVTAKNLTTAKMVTITVTAADRPGLSATMDIRVRPKATSVTLLDNVGNPLTAQSNITLKIYALYPEQIQLSAVCNPHLDDEGQGAFQKVIYSSSNTAVATVDAATGLVTAVKAGTARITATATDGSNKSASVNVTVTCEPTGITVSGPGGVGIGKSVTLKATVAPEGVAPQAITWSIITGGDLATISKTGVLSVKKGVAAGQTIEVKAALTANPSISYVFETVTKDPVTSVVTNYGTGSRSVKVPLYQGYMQISATCLPATALNELIYTSSNTRVATVDQYGKVTFLTAGTVMITIAAIDGSNCKTVLAVVVMR